MNNNLEFENEDPSPDSIEDNHPRTNYGEGYGGKETLEEVAERLYPLSAIPRKLWLEGAKWQQERMLKFILDEDNHTEGELGNSCIDVQTLVHFIEQFKKK